MAEVLAAVSVANELLGLFSELRLAYDSLGQRVENFRGNPEEFGVLKIELSAECKKMRVCHDNLKEYQEQLSKGSLQYEQINLESIAKVLQLVQNNVNELDKKLSEKRSGLGRFIKAKEISHNIGKQSSRINTVKAQLNEIIENLKNFVNENDLFKKDYSSIPRVRFPVHLDFSNPDTVEGKLMTKLLGGAQHSGGDERDCNVTAVVGANGMGGVGKTTALCKLVQERLVRDAFPDGIHFMVVGKDATPASLVMKLKRIVRNSGGERWADKINDSEPLESVVETTSTWFAGKKVLFICDDLWETPSSRSGYYKELSGLLSHCCESYIIISTRNDKIGPQGPAKVVFEPRETVGSEARGIFLKSSGLNEEEVCASHNNDLVDEILELCRGVPLTLSIAGAQVRLHDGGPTESLERLLQCILKGRLSLWEEETLEEYPCFAAIVEGSLEGIAKCLEKDKIFMKRLCAYLEQSNIDEGQGTYAFVSDRFHRLCILPRNARVTKDTFFGAWRISNEQVGWKILQALKDSHLLLEFEDAKEDFVFGLHDVVLDHCIEESTRRGKNKYSTFHREFLSHIYESSRNGTEEDHNKEANAFWKATECDKFRPWWWIISNKKTASENYILANLLRHLREGRRLVEALALLSHAEWTKLRIENGGIAALKTDFDMIEKAMYEHSQVVEAGEELACELVHQGINSIWKMTSEEWPKISKHPDFLPTHAFGHFNRNRKQSWIAEWYLQSAERFASSPWLKPRPAFLHTSDTVDNAFDTTERIIDVTVMWIARQVIAANRTRLLWIDMKTMGVTHTEEVRIDDDEIRSVAFDDVLSLVRKVVIDSSRIER